MIKFFVFKLFFILIISVPALASSVSLTDLLEDTYTTHPFYKSLQIQKDIAELSIKKQTSFLDPTVALTPRFSKNKPTASSPFLPEEVTSMGLNSTFSKKFWLTGGTFGANANLNSSESTYSAQAQQFGLLSDYYENSIGISYVHPLLKNRAGVLDKIGFKTKMIEYQLTQVKLLDQQQSFTLGIIYQFLDWYAEYKELNNLKSRYFISKRQYTDTKNKFSKNLAERVDVIQSEDSLKNLEQLFILKESTVSSKIKQLELIVSFPIEGNVPALSLLQPPRLKKVSERDFERAPQIMILNQQKELLEYQYSLISEQKRPNLNVNFAANLKGGDSALKDSLNLNKPDFSVSMTFTDSLKKTGLNSDDAILIKSIKNTDLLIQSTKLELESKLIDLQGQYVSVENVIALNERRLSLAIERVKEEIKRYNHGRSQFSFLIQAQDNVQFIETILLQNKIAMYRIYFNYMASLGLLDEALKELYNEGLI